MKNFIIFIILFIEVLHADVSLVASPMCKVSELTQHEVKKLFMLKKTSFNNEDITVLDNSNKEVYEKFLSIYLKKTPRKMKVYWVRMLFTGKMIAPKKFSSEELKDLETKNSCYLSYVELENKPEDWSRVVVK